MISVVIPTFRRPKQLIDAVNSVLSQTYNEFEVIIIDDDPHGMRPEYTDNRIIYLKNERSKGGNGARNTGVLKASGEYIAFLDDDDEWLPNKLMMQVERMNSLDDTWAGCYCRWITDGQVSKPGPEGNLLLPFLKNEFEFGASSTLLIRKHVFAEVGLWDEELIRHQDWELMLRIFAKYNFAFVDSPLLIVNGHNMPVYAKYKNVKTVYLKKFDDLCLSVPMAHLNKYKSSHYQELSLYAALEGKFAEAVDNFRKARSLSPLSLFLYFKILAYTINAKTLKLKFGVFRKHMKFLYEN